LKGAEQGEVGLGGQGKVESSGAVVVSEQDAKDVAHDIMRQVGQSRRGEAFIATRHVWAWDATAVGERRREGCSGGCDARHAALALVTTPQ
jgi:hypothetical protein